MLDIRTVLNRVVLSLFAFLFSFSFVKADLGDYLVKFGVCGNEICSKCGIRFGEATRELCYNTIFGPRGNCFKEVTDFMPWYCKFGNFCFIDLRDDKCLESCHAVSNGCKKYCRACMIKRLVEIKGEYGFRLREFKDRSVLSRDSSCIICLSEFDKGSHCRYYRCENWHAICRSCFKSYISFCAQGYNCPTCKCDIFENNIEIPNIRFIEDWEVS